MKKLIALVMGMLLVPTMAMGMQSMDNGEMEGVTGQAGVSIAVDDFKMYQNIDGLWYTDTDGMTSANANPVLGTDAADTAGGAASIGIDRLSVMVEVNAITGQDSNALSSTGRALQGNYENTDAIDPGSVTNNDADSAFVARPISIDVTDRLPVLSTGATNNNEAVGTGDPVSIAGVKIQLGTMEIVQSDLQLSVGIAANDKSTGNSIAAVNAGKDFGTLNIGQTTMAILDGSIEIAPH